MALIHAADVADALTLRTNTAEAAQSTSNAKHQELITKYMKLVEKWLDAAACRRHFLVKLSPVFYPAFYPPWSFLLIFRSGSQNMKSDVEDISPLQLRATTSPMDPPKTSPSGDESRIIHHLNTAMHSVQRSQSLLEETY